MNPVYIRARMRRAQLAATARSGPQLAAAVAKIVVEAFKVG